MVAVASGMADRPNILFLLDDQHRADWLGCAGASFLETPNLDRLAERGVRFTNVTTTCPVCAPSRVGLASGIYPFRLGATDNDGVLPPHVPTYYQHFRDHGYRVGGVGKFDLLKGQGFNGLQGRRPQTYQWGFTDPLEVEGKMHAGRSPTPQGPYGAWLAEQGLYDKFHQDYVHRQKDGWMKNGSGDSVLPEAAWADRYIGKQAEDTLTSLHESGHPWFLFVSFVGPHNPFDPPVAWAEKYREVDIPDPIDPAGEHNPPHRRPLEDFSIEEHREARRQYAAAIAGLDDVIGQLLTKLEATGAAKNTVIAFSSDHGEMAGDHGRYTKGVPYEASTQVPMLVAGPGIEPGVSEAVLEMQDIHPTLVELAGLPELERVDARSFVPSLRNPTTAHRDFAFSQHRGFRMARTPEWKLVLNDNAPEELYHLNEDRDEVNNVASANPERCAELFAMTKSVGGSAWWHG